MGFAFRKDDSVLFCADTIPSPINEANRYVLESKLRAQGVRLFKKIHVSGHASKEDHRQLIRLVKPDHIIPCHGTLTMRAAYAILASEEGYELGKTVHLINNGQSITL
jgi:ribonuclease J